MATDIIYVDKDDNEIGTGSIENAHSTGIIHRVVRIFLFNSKGELLLQKRASHVKSNPDKWQESAAGHVDEGETYMQAAERETQEEIGVIGLSLKEIKKTYTEEVEGKKRRRFNMLYTATYDGEVIPNPEEVSTVRWISLGELHTEIARHAEQFTEGFRLSVKEL